MSKRKNGEGNYGSKTIKGVEYKYYRFPDGRYIYAKKSKDLEEKKKEYERKDALMTPKKSNLYTFDDYCLLWLKQHHAMITPRVYDEYERVINTRIKGYDIGNMQIKSLTADAFNTLFRELATKYSKASIDKTWTVIRQVLTYGMEEDEIPKISFNKIHRPNETEVAVKKKDVPFITKEDMNLLIKEIEDNPKKYGDGTKVLIFIMQSGLRISEAIGLKWKFVDKDFESIKVQETTSVIVKRDADLNPIKNADGNLVYESIQKGAKSADGQRQIPVSSKCKEILQFFYDNKPHKQDDFVFTSSTGNPFGKRALERTLSRVIKNTKCSRDDYTPHCLRHGFGSVLIQNGTDIKVVSELLGHSDVAFTYNTYIGVSQSDKSNAIKSVFD